MAHLGPRLPGNLARLGAGGRAADLGVAAAHRPLADRGAGDGIRLVRPHATLLDQRLDHLLEVGGVAHPLDPVEPWPTGPAPRRWRALKHRGPGGQQDGRAAVGQPTRCPLQALADALLPGLGPLFVGSVPVRVPGVAAGPVLHPVQGSHRPGVVAHLLHRILAEPVAAFLGRGDHVITHFRPVRGLVCHRVGAGRRRADVHPAVDVTVRADKIHYAIPVMILGCDERPVSGLADRQELGRRPVERLHRLGLAALGTGHRGGALVTGLDVLDVLHGQPVPVDLVHVVLGVGVAVVIEDAVPEQGLRGEHEHRGVQVPLGAVSPARLGEPGGIGLGLSHSDQPRHGHPALVPGLAGKALDPDQYGSAEQAAPQAGERSGDCLDGPYAKGGTSGGGESTGTSGGGASRVLVGSVDTGTSMGVSGGRSGVAGSVIGVVGSGAGSGGAGTGWMGSLGTCGVRPSRVSAAAPTDASAFSAGVKSSGACWLSAIHWASICCAEVTCVATAFIPSARFWICPCSAAAMLMRTPSFVSMAASASTMTWGSTSSVLTRTGGSAVMSMIRYLPGTVATVAGCHAGAKTPARSSLRATRRDTVVGRPWPPPSSAAPLIGGPGQQRQCGWTAPGKPMAGMSSARKLCRLALRHSGDVLRSFTAYQPSSGP